MISRRFFLFGTAATLATVALGDIAAADIAPQNVQRIPFGNGAPYKVRRIEDLIIYGSNAPLDGEPINFKLMRYPQRMSLVEFSLNPRANFRWRPIPGQEPIFLENSCMVIEATGSPSQIVIYGKDDGESFAETYTFPGGECSRLLMGNSVSDYGDAENEEDYNEDEPDLWDS